MNQLILVASVVEREVMRYTPAGIPIMSVRLSHQSQQHEAGTIRTVECDIFSLAAGDIAGRLEQVKLGESFRFTGFLARKNRNSKSLVFHIVHFDELIKTGT